MPKHAGWASVQAGKEAWIIDNDGPSENWFIYDHGNIDQMRCIRKQVCKKLKGDNASWH